MIEKCDLLKLVSATQNYDECLKIVRKYIIHGTPFVFKDRENDYYEFRDTIAKQFKIGFHEVLILGSAKLGYSYHKDSVFSPESDIDVAEITVMLKGFENDLNDPLDIFKNIENKKDCFKGKKNKIEHKKLTDSDDAILEAFYELFK